MIRSVLSLFFIYSLLCSFKLEADIPEPSGRRIRTIIGDKYADDSVIIGGTTGSWAFGTNTGLIMDREFSYVTPENDFKQWYIHPDNSSTWNWSAPDKWIDHISQNNQILRMHGPIGPQCSSWAMGDNRTAIELETNMNDFMQAVCERYNGTPGFNYMDVVNETVIGGSWHKNKSGSDGWENPWYIIGQDTDKNNTPLYIKKAFEIAQQYAPDIKLIYNHHEHPDNTSSWNLIKETVIYLRNQGLRVDGIGWQAHVDNGWDYESNLEKLRDLIDWAHNNELEFHITEASVWLKNGNTEKYLEEQADTYSTILKVLLQKRFTGKIGWNTWHIDDGHGWNTEWYPSLFNASYQAKPAYYAVQAVLENPDTVFSGFQDNIPAGYKLYENYPDPFENTTTIVYYLPESTHVVITVYNTAGKRITTLVNEYKANGGYEAIWNGKNFSGKSMPSGIYIYNIKTTNFIRTGKMILIK